MKNVCLSRDNDEDFMIPIPDWLHNSPQRLRLCSQNLPNNPEVWQSYPPSPRWDSLAGMNTGKYPGMFEAMAFPSLQ